MKMGELSTLKKDGIFYVYKEWEDEKFRDNVFFNGEFIFSLHRILIDEDTLVMYHEFTAYTQNLKYSPVAVAYSCQVMLDPDGSPRTFS